MSYNIKTLKEQLGEINEELKTLKTSVETEERSFNDEELSKWDSLENEYNQVKGQLETAERFERLPQAKPNNEAIVQEYQPKRNVITRSDANRAAKAFFAKNKDFMSEDFSDAAERCNFNYKADSFNLKLRSQSDVLERSQTVGTDAKGGYSVNDGIVDSFEKALESVWNWSNICTVRRTADGSPISVLTLDDRSNDAAYTAELAQVANTDLDFSRTTLNAYKISSGCFPVSNELISDASVDIMSIVGTALGERIGRFLASEITNGAGSGSDNITGFTEGSVHGAMSTFKDGLAYTDLISLWASVPESYRNRPSCVWQMHSTTFADLMALADSTGLPMFLNNLQSGPSYQLLGKSIVINDDLPAASTFAQGVTPVYFGDFSRYQVRIVRDVNIRTSNELYFREDAVAAIATMRVDAKLVDSGVNPIRHLTLNTASGAPSVDD